MPPQVAHDCCSVGRARHADRRRGPRFAGGDGRALVGRLTCDRRRSSGVTTTRETGVQAEKKSLHLSVVLHVA